MINSRSIGDLDRDTAQKAVAFRDACDAAGIDIIFTSTYRDGESQNALYAQGRTAPGKVVTKVKGGGSYHNWRCAFDFVPIANGKAVWDDEHLWERCGAIGEECGLEWGGDWPRFPDKPHMQNTRGRSTADFKKLGCFP